MALYQFEERKLRVAQGAFVADSRKKGSNVLFQLSVLFLLFLLRYHLQFPTFYEFLLDRKDTSRKTHLAEN